ncbi:MAG: membrane associated rhomboid family serine protease [Polaribacter sp.]|jgi:membrane associated rhomboid family serine protease
MNRITEVTKMLIIINVIVYVAATFIFNGAINEYLIFQHPLNGHFQPVQLIGHMFMHGGTMHLLFNMYMLYMFGPPLESLWGEKRFLLYYLFAGFGGIILFALVGFLDGTGGAAVGASGAIFGLLIGFGMKFPEQRLMLIIPPIPVKAKYLVMFLAGFELFLGVGNFDTGIAHFGHLGGALFGFLLIKYWDRFGSKF